MKTKLTDAEIRAENKAALDRLAKGCGGCIGNVLRLLTFAFVVAEFVKHLPF